MPQPPPVAVVSDTEKCLHFMLTHPRVLVCLLGIYNGKIHSMSLRTILHQYCTMQEHNYQTGSGYMYQNINHL